LEDEHKQGALKFRNQMLNMPEVMQCYFVTGDADYILIYSAGDMKEYEEFTREVLLVHPHIKYFSTHVVMEPVKMTLTVPMEPLL